MNALNSQQQEQKVDSQTQPRIVLPDSYVRCHLPGIIENIKTRSGYDFFRAKDSVVFFEALGRLGKTEVLRIAFKAKLKTTRITGNEGRTEQEIKEEVLDQLFPEWRTICNPEPITN